MGSTMIGVHAMLILCGSMQIEGMCQKREADSRDVR